VAADGDFVVIPGSRGSLSYLVKPIGDGEVMDEGEGLCETEEGEHMED